MSPASALQATLTSHEVVAVLGPGGVGKTTLSATLALEAAEEARTLVVTIDPAKRLASALGLKLGHEVAPVRPNLDAVMVDTKRALDEMITEYAPSPDKLDSILASDLYQHLSSALVGSEEFAAMGLLHEFHEKGGYDVIIVDTPPSRHALDFLTVNERLLSVFESGLTRWLFQPGKLFSVAGGRMAKVAARWTSRDYLDTLSDFLLHFEEMFLAMEGRVRTMDALLSDPSRTAIGLVTVPEPGAVHEALDLANGLSELDLEPRFVIANRTYPPLSGEPAADHAVLLEHYRRLASQHAQGLDALAGVAAHVHVVPALPRVRGLDGLDALRPYLRTERARGA